MDFDQNDVGVSLDATSFAYTSNHSAISQGATRERLRTLDPIYINQPMANPEDLVSQRKNEQREIKRILKQKKSEVPMPATLEVNKGVSARTEADKLLRARKRQMKKIIREDLAAQEKPVGDIDCGMGEYEGDRSAWRNVLRHREDELKELKTLQYQEKQSSIPVETYYAPPDEYANSMPSRELGDIYAEPAAPRYFDQYQRSPSVIRWFNSCGVCS